VALYVSASMRRSAASGFPKPDSSDSHPASSAELFSTSESDSTHNSGGKALASIRCMMSGTIKSAVLTEAEDVVGADGVGGAALVFLAWRRRQDL